MKKWLGEASAFCGHRKTLTKEENASEPSTSKESKTTGNLVMGVNQSSEFVNGTNEQEAWTENCDPKQLSEASVCNTSVSVIIPTSSGAQSMSHNTNGNIQVHSPSTFNSSNTGIGTVTPTATPQAGCSCAGIHPLLINSESVPLTSSVSPTSPQYQSDNVPLYRLHNLVDAFTTPISSQPQMSVSLNRNAVESSDIESHSESCTNTWCRPELPLSRTNANDSSSIYGTTVPSKPCCSTDSPDVPNNFSSVCSHWGSTCRVKVQVEVECVSSGQRSPSTSRRGLRSMSFPKRRHKAKSQTKDISGGPKKKKSPLGFLLNTRLKSPKNESENSLPSVNAGCGSCVCPGYAQSDEGRQSDVPSDLSAQPSVADLTCFNPDSFTNNGLEDTVRQERQREVAERADAPPAFIPFYRDNSNSLALSLTYNSVFDLEILLDRSLRLGFGGSRGNNSFLFRERFHPLGQLSVNSLMPHSVHTQVDYIHCLVPDLLNITNCGFYWGKMDRYEAERLLENRPEGTFLLRDSAQEEHLFSVSFRRYGRSLHARIEQLNHKFSFDSHDPGVFASSTVCGLIEHYKDPTSCMFFEPLLTNPLSRTYPFPLQHLCRATICFKSSYDGISQLQLPLKLKNYLKEYHYKQRVRVRHLDQ